MQKAKSSNWAFFGNAVVTVMLLCGALTLTGCSASKSRLSSLPTYDKKVELSVVWDRTIGDGSDSQYLQMVPAVTDRAVFAVDANGLLVKVKRRNGKKIWSLKTGRKLSGGVAADADVLALTSRDGDVQLRRTDDGALLWEVNIGREILARPVLSWSSVFVQTGDGRVYSFNRQTGAQQWLYSADVPVLALRGSAAPILAGPVLVAGFANGRVVVIRQDDGQVLYERAVALPEGRTDLERMIDIDGDIWVENQLAVLTSYQGELMVLQLTNGKVIWSQPFSSTVGAVSGDGSVVAVNDEGRVSGFSQYYQTEQWSTDRLKGRLPGSPAWIDGRVLLGDGGGYIHVIDANNGALIGRKRIDRDPLMSRPVIDKSDIIVQTEDGVLALMRIES